MSEDVHQVHMKNKGRARTEEIMDNNKAKCNKVYVFSQDTQAGKLVPCVNAGAIYYKTKLNVHNFLHTTMPVTMPWTTGGMKQRVT